MNGQPSAFTQILGADPVLSRVQANIASVLNPLAQAVQSTPIMGATPPPWIQPNLLNGWTNNGGGYAVCAFHRDALGYVHAKGVLLNSSGGALAGGVVASTIMVFPVGYRPLEYQRFAVRTTASAVQFIRVQSDGYALPEVGVAAGGTCDFAFIFLAEA